MAYKPIITSCISNLFNMITLKKGSLMILSLSLSSTGTVAIWDIVLYGTDTRRLILPISVYCIGMMLYTLFVLVDFITGLKASKHVSFCRYKDKARPYIKSNKLYRSMFKILSIGMVSFLFLAISIMIEVVDIGFFYKTAVSIQTGIIILACGFEYYSVGENHLKRYGYKPRFFLFFDKILSVFEKKITEKIDESFTGIKEVIEEIKEHDVITSRDKK